jgi:hypothetical protein
MGQDKIYSFDPLGLSLNVLGICSACFCNSGKRSRRKLMRI